MSNNPLKMIMPLGSLNMGSFGGNLGGGVDASVLDGLRSADFSKGMRTFGAKQAAMKAAAQAGDLNASNIQSLGFSKYGDIAAKGFENYEGDDNLLYDKTSGRTSENYGTQRRYVLGEGEELGKAGSDSERRRRRGMIDLNEPQVSDNINSMPEPTSSLVNPFGLQAQRAIGGTFGSLFSRQNSMGSALAKRACKYKNKK